jgi:hypothetical protein
MDRFRLLSALALVLAFNAEARAEKFLVVFERLEHRDNAKGGDGKSIVRARHEFVLTHGESFELKDTKAGDDGFVTTISGTLVADAQKDHLVKVTYQFAGPERMGKIFTQVNLNCGDTITLGELRNCVNTNCRSDLIRVHIKASTKI